MKITVEIKTENQDINGKPDPEYQEKYARLAARTDDVAAFCCKIAKGED